MKNVHHMLGVASRRRTRELLLDAAEPEPADR
jgi:hypothetical protein